MEFISSDEFYTLCQRSDVKLLKTTYSRPKLFETAEGEMIKIFYPRRKAISSDRLRPYALRFSKNAEQLKNLGFNTLTIKKIQFCSDLSTYVITYTKLSGLDARVIYKRNPEILKEIASFIAMLHSRGIFFRSLHLENILQQNNGDFTLLDIVDLQFKKKSLSAYLRFRNLKHCFQVKEDRAIWTKKCIKNFLKIYFKDTQLSWVSKIFLRGLVIFSKQ